MSARPAFVAFALCGMRLTSGGRWGMVGAVMMRIKSLVLALAGLCVCGGAAASAVEVILTGGVALRSWEILRGPAKHDKWWANFVRASTIRIAQAREENPKVKIRWVVYRPAYITRGLEEKEDYLTKIRNLAKQYSVNLVFVDTAEQAYKAINTAPQGGERIHAFYYFGHSNAHAFMLDYSNSIIGASKQWIHEDDLAARLNRAAFAPDAKCFSYGCYTGLSMSAKWRAAIGIPMLGNEASTRYQPVGDGRLPEGAGKWTYGM